MVREFKAKTLYSSFNVTGDCGLQWLSCNRSMRLRQLFKYLTVESKLVVLVVAEDQVNIKSEKYNIPEYLRVRIVTYRYRLRWRGLVISG